MGASSSTAKSPSTGDLHGPLLYTQKRRYTQTQVAGGIVARAFSRASKHWERLRSPQFEEGLDFEEIESEVTAERFEEVVTERANGWQRLVHWRWAKAALVATLMSIAALLIALGIHGITEAKRGAIQQQLERGNHGKGFGLFFLYNLLLGGGAAVFVALLEIKARGSGIPEIKAYLNGRDVHGVISLRTLFSKIAGIILAVGGSLVVGKEGPCIHAGAVIGAVVSQGRSENLNVRFCSMRHFRDDREKRMMASIGSACGIAAAFAAPVGGVLFVIEEAATFWSVVMTWRTFFSTMLTTALVALFLPWVDGRGADEALFSSTAPAFGTFSSSAVVSFGSYEGASRAPCYPLQQPFRAGQLIVCVAMPAGVRAFVCINAKDLH